MMKFNAILEEIKRTSAAISAAEAKGKELANSYINFDSLKDRHNRYKAIEADLAANEEHLRHLKISRHILKSNACVALFNEVLPVLVEVLEKYKGKPYGEKTKQKISDEVQNRAGCRAYIGSRYSSQTVEFYPVNSYGNDYNISIGTKYNNGQCSKFLIDNKIQAVPVEDLMLCYVSREYVEDIPARVAQLEKLHAEAVEAQAKLKEVCDAFNALAVGNIGHIYEDKRIYEHMEV